MDKKTYTHFRSSQGAGRSDNNINAEGGRKTEGVEELNEGGA